MPDVEEREVAPRREGAEVGGEQIAAGVGEEDSGSEEAGVWSIDRDRKRAIVGRLLEDVIRIR